MIQTFGDVANGQIANELPVVRIMHDYSFALKGDIGMLLHVEEICRAEMIIPLGIVGIDTGCLDLYLGL